MSTEIIDRAAFEAWLKAQEPTDFVGHAHDSRTCPLGMYLHVKGGIESVSVWPLPDAEGEILLDHVTHVLSGWANQFGSFVDLAFDSRGTAFPAVTAAEALDILNSVPT